MSAIQFWSGPSVVYELYGDFSQNSWPFWVALRCQVIFWHRRKNKQRMEAFLVGTYRSCELTYTYSKSSVMQISSSNQTYTFEGLIWLHFCDTLYKLLKILNTPRTHLTQAPCVTWVLNKRVWKIAYKKKWGITIEDRPWVSMTLLWKGSKLAKPKSKYASNRRRYAVIVNYSRFVISSLAKAIPTVSYQIQFNSCKQI